MTAPTTSATEPSLPLLDLERGLRPLRRVLSRRRGAEGAPRHLPANCLRLLRRLDAVAVPDAVRAELDEVRACFEEATDADGEAREERLDTAWQLLLRVDRTLGLPVRGLRFRRPAAPRPPARAPAADGPTDPPSPGEGGQDVDQAEPPAASDKAGGRKRRGRRGARGNEARTSRKREERRGQRAEPEASDGEAAADEPAAGRSAGGRRSRRLAFDASLDDVGSWPPGPNTAESLLDALTRPPAHRRVLSPIHGAGRLVSADAEGSTGPSPGTWLAIGGRVARRWTVLSPGGDGASATSWLRLRGAATTEVRWHAPFAAGARGAPPVGDKVVVAARVPDGTDGVPAHLVDARVVGAAQGRASLVTYGTDDDATWHQAVLDAAERLDASDDPVGRADLSRLGLPKLGEALRAVHVTGVVPGAGPASAPGEAARRRLAFDELCVLAVASRLQGDGSGRAGRGIAQTLQHDPLADLDRRSLMTTLDDPSQVALEAIKRDLRGPSTMRRVLFGDTASRLDDVVLHAVLSVVAARSQVLVVAPSSPMAQVLAERWDALLRPLGHTVARWRGDPRGADRERLKRGEISVYVGDPDLLADLPEFRRLSLVVTFEQVDHGAGARPVREGKGALPDQLVVVRTPLPFGIAAQAWPGFALTDLRIDPPPVATARAWSADDREEAYRALGAAVADGRSAMVVFPLRAGGADLLDVRELQHLADTLRGTVFDQAPVAVFHGAAAPDDRARALRDFAERRARVLFSTAPVEWASPMPRGLVGLVEHADRLDLQRLLSLRARAGGEGTLHLVAEATDHPTVAALVAGQDDRRLVAGAPEAFRLGEAAGASSARHRWVSPTRDLDLLVEAQGFAQRLVQEARQRPGSTARWMKLARSWWPLLRGDAPVPFPEGAAASGRRRRRRRRR